MKPMFGYIPSNLDLNSEKHRDKFYFILTFIFYGRIFDKRKKSASFIQLYSPFLKRVINGRYKDYLQDLMEMKVIETDNRYIKKIKSKSYRLTENYRKSKIKQERIMDEKIISNYRNYKAEQKSRISENHYKYLFECLEKIEIDYEAAMNFLNNHAENFEQYNSWYCSIERIHNKDWFFTVDQKAGRVHNNITNLAKNFRPFLSFNRNKLIEIDISNSQPLLFNVLISRYLLRNTSAYNCGINLPYVPQNSDLRLYREITEQGRFYEFMMNELGIKEDRDRFKIRMFTKLFYGKVFESEERTAFKKMFPEVSEIIDYYKRINYRDLAIDLQRVEAEIMINSVVSRLAERKIFILTVHDSILTIPENIGIVQHVIRDEFSKFNLNPSLKIK
jgi:hypothetical protein